MSDRRTLDVIQVLAPCSMPWEQMTGDEQKRFCTHCGKFVHNLSAMPQEQAEKLVCSAAGNLCVRFAREVKSGRVVTLNYAPRPIPSRRRTVAVIASILSAACFAGTWVGYRLLRKPAPPPMMFVAGMMAPVTVPIPGNPVPGGQQ